MHLIADWLDLSGYAERFAENGIECLGAAAPTPEFPEIEQAHRLPDAQPCHQEA
jgi:hypothetical protein